MDRNTVKQTVISIINDKWVVVVTRTKAKPSYIATPIVPTA